MKTPLIARVMILSVSIPLVFAGIGCGLSAAKERDRSNAPAISILTSELLQQAGPDWKKLLISDGVLISPLALHEYRYSKKNFKNPTADDRVSRSFIPLASTTSPEVSAQLGMRLEPGAASRIPLVPIVFETTRYSKLGDFDDTLQAQPGVIAFGCGSFG